MGDYEEDEHTPYVISEFRFVPDGQQTEELELAVIEKFKTLRWVTRHHFPPDACGIACTV